MIHRLCKANRKGSEEKCLVGFGDWSNLDTGGFIQGAPAGPVNPPEEGAEKALQGRLRGRAPDEQSVPILRSAHTKHDAQSQSEGSGGGVRLSHHQVHSVLHCGTNGCRGTNMNRDVNGASNILQVFLSVINTGERPERFSREREV